MAPNTKDKWVRRFLITETSRHKKGFTVYKVTSVVYPKSMPEAVSRVSIWKRYNEFRKLHLELSTRHDNLRIKESFPDFPKPKFFGRFEAEVIEERRQCAIRLLEFIARHTALFTSNVFVKFFESGHSKDFLTQDCSLSISSDTSEDDYNINYALKGTSYNPTPFHDQENNKDFVNIENLNQENDLTNEEKLLKDHSESNSDNISSKTNNSSQILSQNNNHVEVIDQTEEIDFKENKKQEFSSLTQNPLLRIDNSQINDGSDLPNGVGEEFGSYIIVAAAHMSSAFRHEAVGEFGEAFTQYKLGISKLLDGVQGDPDPQRKRTIKEKISKYLERAEKLYNRHLNCNVSVLTKSQDELKNYKVLRIIGNVMLVRDTQRECNRVIKTVQKPAGSAGNLSDYILRGKIPFMVRLFGCIETDSTIFLILQYASGGKLWEYMKSYHKGRNVVSNWISEKGHTRSASCEAVIQKAEVTLITESPNAEEIKKEVDIMEDEARSGVEQNIVIDPEESLKKLEEEFGGNSSPTKTLPTTDLLAKSHELLRSVDATLKKSNSIASRLNESENLMYCTNKENSDLRDNNIKVENEKEATEAHQSKNCSNLKLDLVERMNSEELKSTVIEKQEKLDTVLSNSKANLIISDPGENSNSLESPGSQSSFKDINKESKMANYESKIVNSEQFQSLIGEDSGIEMDDELWKLPEGTIRFWAAEILATLESLHQQDVIVGDLKPDNILLGNGGHVAISYIVPGRRLQFLKLRKPYSAPELCIFLPTVSPTTSADIWSYGVLLYELFTGIKFQSKHPGPFHSHSILNIPKELSSNVKSLISNVLRYEPDERLTIPEIKSHPFFSSIDWTNLVNSCFI